MNKYVFLLKLAALCEEYQASLEYTKDDDGIHIHLGDEEVFVGHLNYASREITDFLSKKFLSFDQ